MITPIRPTRDQAHTAPNGLASAYPKATPGAACDPDAAGTALIATAPTAERHKHVKESWDIQTNEAVVRTARQPSQGARASLAKQGAWVWHTECTPFANWLSEWTQEKIQEVKNTSSYKDHIPITIIWLIVDSIFVKKILCMQ
nr:hypothetical protein [uncultured Albidiferax sp.]